MCECDIYKHQLIRSNICENCSGPTEIRTRIAGFKVQSANHYTIGPDVLELILNLMFFSSNAHYSQYIQFGEISPTFRLIKLHWACLMEIH